MGLNYRLGEISHMSKLCLHIRVNMACNFTVIPIIDAQARPGISSVTQWGTDTPENDVLSKRWNTWKIIGHYPLEMEEQTWLLLRMSFVNVPSPRIGRPLNEPSLLFNRWFCYLIQNDSKSAGWFTLVNGEHIARGLQRRVKETSWLRRRGLD